MKTPKIIRPGDLAAKGVRSTHGKKYGFMETSQHIFQETMRPYTELVRFEKKAS